MSIATRPSFITLPPTNEGWKDLLNFLCSQFPHIEKALWQARLNAGKVSWNNGELADINSSFEANRTLRYFREVQVEPKIDAEHTIVFQNEHFLIADKPHFLPVTPGGQYVNECLLERLRQQCDLPDIVPAHRLDRETAGLVLFSINAQTRADYCQLFSARKIQKTYSAVANISHLKTTELPMVNLPMTWDVANRIVRSEPQFTHKQIEGSINAQSQINLVAIADQIGLFDLFPITGKTHQLRLHMTSIGAPILNDKLYPVLQDKQPDDNLNPLQLLARELSFIDPISNIHYDFISANKLASWVQ